jgi:hypothetical protein
MERLVILLERPSDFVVPLLTRATLDAVCARHDITLAGICVRRPKSYPRLVWRHLQNGWRLRFRRWWKNQADPGYRLSWPLDLHRMARCADCRVLTPPHHDLNHPGFVAGLRTVVRPTLALTLLCGQRYGRELLGALGYAVNYHNGQLPEYRGLHATSWEIYRGAAATGFTFHRMVEQLDCGPILLASSLPIPVAANLWTLEYAKAQAAAALLPQLLELMMARAPGKPQSGAGNYYSGKDNTAIRTIADPATLTSGELARRLQAFGSLFLPANGRWFAAAQLEPTTPCTTRARTPHFQAADGVWLRAVRLRRLKHFKSP